MKEVAGRPRAPTTNIKQKHLVPRKPVFWGKNFFLCGVPPPPRGGGGGGWGATASLTDLIQKFLFVLILPPNVSASLYLAMLTEHRARFSG